MPEETMPENLNPKASSGVVKNDVYDSSKIQKPQINCIAHVVPLHRVRNLPLWLVVRRVRKVSSAWCLLGSSIDRCKQKAQLQTPLPVLKILNNYAFFKNYQFVIVFESTDSSIFRELTFIRIEGTVANNEGTPITLDGSLLC